MKGLYLIILISITLNINAQTADVFGKIFSIKSEYGISVPTSDYAKSDGGEKDGYATKGSNIKITGRFKIRNNYGLNLIYNRFVNKLDMTKYMYEIRVIDPNAVWEYSTNSSWTNSTYMIGLSYESSNNKNTFFWSYNFNIGLVKTLSPDIIFEGTNTNSSMFYYGHMLPTESNNICLSFGIDFKAMLNRSAFISFGTDYYSYTQDFRVTLSNGYQKESFEASQTISVFNFSVGIGFFLGKSGLNASK